MNIFYLSHDPQKCVEMMYNTHVVKMVVETCQILSTAHRVLDGDDVPEFIYKCSSKNHPSTIWARTTRANYLWLAVLVKHMAKEYTHRYGRIHMSEAKGLVDFLQTPPKNIPDGDFSEFYLAMPDYCKCDDPIESYRMLYVTDKIRLCKYKNRPYPDWVLNSIV